MSTFEIYTDIDSVPTSAGWSEMVSQDFDNITENLCQFECTLLVQNCDLYVMDGTRCHLGNVSNNLQTTNILTNGPFEIKILQGNEILM